MPAKSGMMGSENVNGNWVSAGRELGSHNILLLFCDKGWWGLNIGRKQTAKWTKIWTNASRSHGRPWRDSSLGRCGWEVSVGRDESCRNSLRGAGPSPLPATKWQPAGTWKRPEIYSEMLSWRSPCIWYSRHKLGMCGGGASSWEQMN